MINRPLLAGMGGAGLLAIAGVAAAQNLITNPGFESGNTGFFSDYGFSSGGNCCEGQYTVRDNGNSFNGSFVNPPPSSPGSALMLVVNGSTVPNLRIWYQTVSVVPGARYQLNMRGCTAVAGGPAILQWQIDGALIGASRTLPGVTAQWVDIPAEWTAPADVSSIVLAVRDLNTATFPNDFYLDDLSMTGVTCAADFNADGEVNADDLADYINCYFSQPPCPLADFNADGDVNPDDLGDYINAFFGPPC